MTTPPKITPEQLSSAAIEMADRLARENGQLRAEIERLRAALREREWRDIATAPKDGTEVVLWGPCRPSNSRSLYGRDANIGWWSNGAWSTRVGGEVCEATHWQPLEPPPRALLPAETPQSLEGQ